MEQHYNQTTDLFLEEPVIYAGFWERFAAAFIDGLILIIPSLVLTLFVPDGIDDLLGIVVGWLYAALQESGPAQATIGKKALGIRVTAADGGPMSFGQATGRYFGKLVSTLILFIGYLMMLWDDKKQTLHDKMANAYVVKA